MNDRIQDVEKTSMARPRAPAGPRPAPASLVDVREIGRLGAVNPLVAAANPILIALPRLRTASAPADVTALRAKLIEMIQNFDLECTRAAIPDDQRNIARYALCTVVDEAVQMTPWGGSANWAQRSLLVHFFQENWGGEKFFQILDRMAETPARFTGLLELFYVCVSLGFMGRFQLQGPAGRQNIAELRERLFLLTRQGRAEPNRQLSDRWEGVAVESRKFRGFAASGFTAGALALLCLGTFSWYAHALGARLADLRLDQLALKRTELSKVALVPAAKPRLEQLLGGEIQRSQVKVRDLKFESVVTLLGETVFESGSAVPRQPAMELLARVAQALDQVEGQVVVTGHTDNVPTRTLRFSSNFELSRERAANVRAILASRMRDPARITAEGKGDTEPVAPNDSPQSKAQNRRVDITLRVPSGQP